MKHFFRILDKFVEVFSAVVTFGILLLVVFQIVMRYVFNSPLIWSEELVRFMLVWLTFFGASLAMSRNEHLSVSIVIDHINEKLRKVILFAGGVITLFFLCFLVYFGIGFALMNMRQISPANSIPMGIVYAAIPVNAFFLILYNLFRNHTSHQDSVPD